MLYITVRKIGIYEVPWQTKQIVRLTCRNRVGPNLLSLRWPCLLAIWRVLFDRSSILASP